MDVFGETFAGEVHAAGLGGLPFSWHPGTGEITGRTALTAAQNTTLDAVIAAHDPLATIPPPDKTKLPLTAEELAEILIAKAAIAQGDIDAIKAAR